MLNIIHNYLSFLIALFIFFVLYSVIIISQEEELEYIRRPLELQDRRTEWNEDCSSVDFQREVPYKINFEQLLMEDIEQLVPIVYKKLELFENDKETRKESVSIKFE